MEKTGYSVVKICMKIFVYLLSHTWIPSAVQTFPWLYMPHARDRYEYELIVRSCSVEWILVEGQLAVRVRPQ